MSQSLQPETAQSQIADLTARVKALESHYLTKIVTPVGPPSMAVDVSVPEQYVYDGGNVLRVLLGKLDRAGGSYAGQYGLVVNDSSGATIADTTGLQKVMVSAASATWTTGSLANSQNVWANAATTQTGTWVVGARGQNYLALANTIFSPAILPNNGTAMMRIAIMQSGSVVVGSVPLYAAVSAFESGTMFKTFSLGAGTYSAVLQYQQSNAGNTMPLGLAGVTQELNILQLGG